MTDDVSALVAELKADLDTPHDRVYACPASGESRTHEGIGPCSCGKDARDARTRKVLDVLSRYAMTHMPDTPVLAARLRARGVKMDGLTGPLCEEAATALENAHARAGRWMERSSRAHVALENVKRQRDKIRAALVVARDRLHAIYGTASTGSFVLDLYEQIDRALAYPAEQPKADRLSDPSTWSNERLATVLIGELCRHFDAGGISHGRSWYSKLAEPARDLLDGYRPNVDVADLPAPDVVVRAAEDRRAAIFAQSREAWMAETDRR